MIDKLPDIMTEAERNAFISRFNTKAPTGLRNATLLTLMRKAGLRVCEIVGLKTGDVRQDQLDGRPITCLRLETTKGNRERIVYLDEAADHLLQAWLERKRALGLGRYRTVFTTLKGAPLKDSYLRELCVRKGAEAGIAWRVHPHALRHTFATNLLEDTGDLALVQDALGHADPGTTRIYAKVRNSRLARAMTGQKQPSPPEFATVDPDVQALAHVLAKLSPEQRQALAAAVAAAGQECE